MHTSHARWHRRCRQIGGYFCRLWGRIMRNPGHEFRGDQMIIDAKLERYYQRSQNERARSLIGSFVERRRAFHVVV
jgi:hypothetical protein